MAADEEEAAFFREGDPGKGAGDLVAFDLDAPKHASLDFPQLTEVLDDGVAVCRELDSVLGVGFCEDASQDVAALFGVFDPLAIDIVDIDISRRVPGDTGTCRVIGPGIFRDPGIVAAFLSGYVRREAVDDLEPDPFKQPALGRDRS